MKHEPDSTHAGHVAGEVEVRAPAKVTLFGEHSVNWGQPAIGCAVGLWVELRLAPSEDRLFRISGAGRVATYTERELLDLRMRLDSLRVNRDFRELVFLMQSQFFLPAAYILGHAVSDFRMPPTEITVTSSVPIHAGLGSSGAVHAALALGLAKRVVGGDYHVAAESFSNSMSGPDWDTIARWAYLADVIAHGGIASGMDPQTSLIGGLVEFDAEHGGRNLGISDDFAFVIGHCGVNTPTREINLRLWEWQQEDPKRVRVFEEIGSITRMARDALTKERWDEVGDLMNRNQSILREIDVSCPELEALIEAAHTAGAYGGKLSGSGCGGIMLALVEKDKEDTIAEAIRAAGGSVIEISGVGVSGATLIRPRGFNIRKT